MTNVVIKILFISAILIGIGSCIYYLKTGNTPISLIQKTSMPVLNRSNVTESITNLFEINKEKLSTTQYLYKWRDKKGIIHYTSEKPDTDYNVETIRLSNETNIVPAVSSANSTQTNQPRSLPQNSEAIETGTDLYSPKGIEQLFEKADSIQKLLNEHYEQENAQ